MNTLNRITFTVARQQVLSEVYQSYRCLLKSIHWCVERQPVHLHKVVTGATKSKDQLMTTGRGVLAGCQCNYGLHAEYEAHELNSGHQWVWRGGHIRSFHCCCLRGEERGVHNAGEKLSMQSM